MLDTLNGSVLTSAKSALKTVKTTAGKIVRAPGDIAEGIAQTVKGVGKGAEGTAKTIPVLLIIAGVGVAGYLIFMGKAGKKVTPSISGNFPELMGRTYRKYKR